MSKQSAAAVAAYFPVTLPIGETGLICVDQSTSVNERHELCSCLLDNVLNLLTMFPEEDAAFGCHVAAAAGHLTGMAYALLASLELAKEEA